MNSLDLDLDDINLTRTILSILVKRLGSEVIISQRDFDDIAYGRILQGRDSDGSFVFKLVDHKNIHGVN